MSQRFHQQSLDWRQAFGKAGSGRQGGGLHCSQVPPGEGARQRRPGTVPHCTAASPGGGGRKGSGLLGAEETCEGEKDARAACGNTPAAAAAPNPSRENPLPNKGIAQPFSFIGPLYLHQRVHVLTYRHNTNKHFL